MCIDKIKQKIQDWRKEWVDCDIPELRKRKESAKLSSFSLVLNSLILACLSAYMFNVGLVGTAVYVLVVSVLCMILAYDLSTDRNRINMWIYLKENNKK